MKVDVFDPATGELLDQVELPLDDVGVPTKAVLDARGHEVVDPVPVAPPIGFVASEPLEVQIRKMITGELLRQAAMTAGAETFEEADDFDVGDLDPTSPYEQEFEGLPLEELKRRKEEFDRVSAGAATAAAEKRAAVDPGPAKGTSPEVGGEGGGPPRFPPPIPRSRDRN